MYEILDQLPDDAIVLDLGSGHGSFPRGAYRFRTFLADTKFEHLPNEAGVVQAHSDALPFASKLFDAVILSHVLEHTEKPRQTLQEIGRVLKRTGAVYIAVPDGRTFTDRLYRKVFRNRGGHISLFDSEQALRRDMTWFFGVPHKATRTLYSSFAYLNRRNFLAASQRREIRIPPLPEPCLLAFTALVSLWDRLFNTRCSVYGWAFYFGSQLDGISSEPNPNVCIRCGAVEENHAGGRTIGYACSQCGARNVDRTGSPFAAR